MNRASFVVAGAIVVGGVSTGALAQSSYTALAFTPLAPLTPGQYFTRTVDISGDGTIFIGQTNAGNLLLRTLTEQYSFSGVAGRWRSRATGRRSWAGRAARSRSGGG